MPLQSLPGKLGLSIPGAATPGFVPRLGAASAPAAPPKGLSGAGKPASPPGDGRVAVAWGVSWALVTPGVAAPLLGAMGYLSGAVSPSDGHDPGVNRQR